MKYFIFWAFGICSASGDVLVEDWSPVEVLSTQTSFVPSGKRCHNDRLIRPSGDTECTPVMMVTKRPVNRTSLGEKVEHVTIADTCITSGPTTNVLCRMGNTLYARSLNRVVRENREGKKQSGHDIPVGKFVGSSSVQLLPGIIPTSACRFKHIKKTGFFHDIGRKLNIRSKDVLGGEACYPKLRGLVKYTDPQMYKSETSGQLGEEPVLLRSESPSIWSSPSSMKTFRDEDPGSSPTANPAKSSKGMKSGN